MSYDYSSYYSAAGALDPSSSAPAVSAAPAPAPLYPPQSYGGMPPPGTFPGGPPPVNPYAPSPYGAAPPNPYGAAPTPASMMMGGPDEVRTIFITGFPNDVKERELNNLLRFLPGYEVSESQHPLHAGWHELLLAQLFVLNWVAVRLVASGMMWRMHAGHVHHASMAVVVPRQAWTNGGRFILGLHASLRKHDSFAENDWIGRGTLPWRVSGVPMSTHRSLQSAAIIMDRCGCLKYFLEQLTLSEPSCDPCMELEHCISLERSWWLRPALDCLN